MLQLLGTWQLETQQVAQFTQAVLPIMVIGTDLADIMSANINKK
jgi:hypothetical protein